MDILENITEQLKHKYYTRICMCVCVRVCVCVYVLYVYVCLCMCMCVKHMVYTLNIWDRFFFFLKYETFKRNNFIFRLYKTRETDFFYSVSS